VFDKLDILIYPFWGMDSAVVLKLHLGALESKDVLRCSENDNDPWFVDRFLIRLICWYRDLGDICKMNIGLDPKSME